MAKAVLFSFLRLIGMLGMWGIWARNLFSLAPPLGASLIIKNAHSQKCYSTSEHQGAFSLLLLTGSHGLALLPLKAPLATDSVSDTRGAHIPKAVVM